MIKYGCVGDKSFEKILKKLPPLRRQVVKAILDLYIHSTLLFIADLKKAHTSTHTEWHSHYKYI